MHTNPSHGDTPLNLNSTLVREKQLSSEIATLGDSMLTIIGNLRAVVHTIEMIFRLFYAHSFV
jgi:hypothetical protein